MKELGSKRERGRERERERKREGGREREDGLINRTTDSRLNKQTDE